MLGGGEGKGVITPPPKIFKSRKNHKGPKHENAKILEIFSGRRDEKSHSPVENLTDREFEIFQLIGKGSGTKEIAEQMHVSPKTVEAHRVNIKNKLKLKTAAELIRYAVRWVEAADREN